MKLIKQNDDSGGLIFRQNTDGKAMKQNFNFGKGWVQNNTNNAYIQIPKTIIPGSPFSILVWRESEMGAADGNTYAHGGVDLGLSKLKMDDRGVSGNINTVKPVFYNGVSINTTFLTRRSFSPAIFMYNGITSINQLDLDNNLRIVTVTAISESIESIIIRGLRTSVWLAKGRIYGFCIYDRELSLDECRYFKNNFLGNEPLNMAGLYAYYDMNAARLFNDGISDYIGVEDIYKGNHAPIIDLPAGTLQEQLDYANSNLFLK